MLYCLNPTCSGQTGVQFPIGRDESSDFFKCPHCTNTVLPCENCWKLVAVNPSEMEEKKTIVCEECGFMTIVSKTLREAAGVQAFDWKHLQKLQQYAQKHHNILSALNNRQQFLKKRMEEEIKENQLISSEDTDDVKEENYEKDEPKRKQRNMEQPKITNDELKKEIQKLSRQLQTHRYQQKLLDLADYNPSLRTPTIINGSTMNFTLVHFHVLRALYSEFGDKQELTELWKTIESFLVKKSYLEEQKQQIYEIQSANKQFSTLDASKRLKCFQYSSKYDTCLNVFKRQSNRYFPMITDVNQQLSELYKSVQSLETPAVAKPSVQYEAVKYQATGLHSRRRSRVTDGFAHSNPQSTTLLLEKQDKVELLQRKIELWRRLSYTVSTACLINC